MVTPKFPFEAIGLKAAPKVKRSGVKVAFVTQSGRQIRTMQWGTLKGQSYEGDIEEWTVTGQPVKLEFGPFECNDEDGNPLLSFEGVLPFEV